ncbi:MAG TPA: multidrug efflux SMR transporter [Pseudogracilibacillus sp.]|nr:multidrug efflux SMR transporter [Pseudogracilibacillus sp.]
MMIYAVLGSAILFEVVGSSLMRLSEGFKKLMPTLGVLLFYILSFYLLSKSLGYLSIGFAYAVWAGIGTALTVLVGVAVFKEHFTLQKFCGIVCVITGVIFLNLTSTGV